MHAELLPFYKAIAGVNCWSCSMTAGGALARVVLNGQLMAELSFASVVQYGQPYRNGYSMWGF